MKRKVNKFDEHWLIPIVFIILIFYLIAGIYWVNEWFHVAGETEKSAYYDFGNVEERSYFLQATLFNLGGGVLLLVLGFFSLKWKSRFAYLSLILLSMAHIFYVFR